MGWYMTYGGRAELIKELTQSETNKAGESRTVLTHCVRGNVLWSVVRVARKKESGELEEHTYIGCDLLRKDKNGWGHKPMSESAHPYYYTCPVSFLEMAPVADQAWRDKVMERHARMSRKVKVGEKYTIENCSSLPWLEITSVKPLQGVYNGTRYKVNKSRLGSLVA